MVVAELLATLGFKTDEASVRKANAAVGGVQQTLEGLSAVVSGFVGALGLGGLVAGFAGAVKATADYGDQTKLLAQRTGVNADALQKLAYAASLSNVGSEELAVGLQHLAKTGVKDVYGETMRLSAQFASMPDGAEKTKLAMEKFGRAGARLIPVLNAGKEGLAGLAQEAVDLGLVMGGDDLDAADDFNDELDRLKGLLAGVRNRLTLGFLKPLKEIAIALRGAASGFMQTHPALMRFLTSADAANYVLTTLALVMGVVAAVGVVLAAPFLAMVAAVLLAGAVLQEFLYYLTGDGESLIGRFVDYYKKEFGSLPAFTKAILDWTGDLINQAMKAFGNKIADFFDPVTTRVADLFRPLTKTFEVAAPRHYDAQGFEIDKTGRRVNMAEVQQPVYGPKDSSGNFTQMAAPSISITVNPSPGMSEKDLAVATKDALWKEWGSFLQEADAGMVK